MWRDFSILWTSESARPLRIFSRKYYPVFELRPLFTPKIPNLKFHKFLSRCVSIFCLCQLWLRSKLAGTWLLLEARHDSVFFHSYRDPTDSRVFIINLMLLVYISLCSDSISAIFFFFYSIAPRSHHETHFDYEKWEIHSHSPLAAHRTCSKCFTEVVKISCAHIISIRTLFTCSSRVRVSEFN